MNVEASLFTRGGSALAAGLALLLAGGAAAASERIELRGAQASAAVTPESLDVDLRDLPAPKDWQPGDAIKEIPRRHTRPAKGQPDDRAAEEWIDPLLEVQEAGSSSAAPDFEFATPILNIAGQGFTGVNPLTPSETSAPAITFNRSTSRAARA